jgi:hypothetical protein
MFNKLDEYIVALSKPNTVSTGMSNQEIIDMLLDVRSDMEIGLIIDGDEMTKYFRGKAKAL